MPDRYLQLEDIRLLTKPERITDAFRKLGYNQIGECFDAEDLELSARNIEAINNAYLIADQNDGGLQVVLFELKEDEWETPSSASNRMKAIANQVVQRDTEFLLLATKDYNQLMLVNPRKTFDNENKRKVSIRKLLIDRANPTAYDRDRLEALAANGKTPQQLYQTHCEAFDVEKLTKRFYEGYKVLFERVQATVTEYNSHSYFQDKDRLHQFSQRLLGRIMFLYFLQKKEFLAGDRQFLTNQYKINDFEEHDCGYYRDILEPLFFETLNSDRPNYDSHWGKIPYLNGGLFDRDYGLNIRDAAGRETPETVVLPNSLFDPGDSKSILGYFNGYNFTIAENVAGDEDVAVDPEMLGKVFENMLEAKERGKSGTFYTPRGIVQFMCAEVLARYLADESGMELEAVQAVMDADPDLPDSDFNKLMTSQQARQLKKALTSIKVLDPAVGSGAFPLGMLQIIVQVKQAIARREGMIVKRGSLTISQWKREIIANNLYGVDIKPGAIEVAKLRMWLSLVVDIPHIEDVEPLPNLDYKLMCGDSLISTIHGEQLIPDPTKEQQLMLAVTPIQQAIQPLLELQKQYFDAQTQERHRLRKEILTAEANVFRVAVRDRLNYWEGKQRELERKIKALKGKVSKAQEKERGEINSKLMELNRFAEEVESGERSLNFFQYHLHFRDVFTEKGGFDVVIGNPPYLGQKDNQKLFEDIRMGDLGQFYKRGMDLLYFFFHQALNLSKPHGLSTFITTNYFLTADSADVLRKDLAQRATILKFINFNELRIFASARGQHNIITFFKKEKLPIKIHLIVTQKTGNASPDIISDIIKGQDRETYYFQQEQTELYDGDKFYIRMLGKSIDQTSSIIATDNIPQKVLKLIESNSCKNTLGNLFYVSRGLESGADKVSNRHIGKNLIDSKFLNQGIYVLSKQEILSMNLSAQEKKIIKPFYKNSDIKQYYCSINAKKFVIYLTRDINIDEYPNIYKHIKKFEKIIKSRDANRGEMQAALKMGKWWVLRTATKNPKKFEKQKIICPQRSSANNFAYNETIWYSSADIYYITQKDESFLLKSLLALLNSSLYYFWLYHKGKKKGTHLELIYTPLIQVPLKILSVEEQTFLIEKVDKILDIYNKKNISSVEKEEIEAIKNQIDSFIFKLYGLSQEEMEYVKFFKINTVKSSSN